MVLKGVLDDPMFCAPLYFEVRVVRTAIGKNMAIEMKQISQFKWRCLHCFDVGNAVDNITQSTHRHQTQRNSIKNLPICFECLHWKLHQNTWSALEGVANFIRQLWRRKFVLLTSRMPKMWWKHMRSFTPHYYRYAHSLFYVHNNIESQYYWVQLIRQIFIALSLADDVEYRMQANRIILFCWKRRKTMDK